MKIEEQQDGRIGYNISRAAEMVALTDTLHDLIQLAWTSKTLYIRKLDQRSILCLMSIVPTNK
jgi:hypothetical protein